MRLDPAKRGDNKNERAMALVSVLLVTVVLLAMAGAFFVAHRSDLALLGSSTYREQTKNACLSVADFVQFKLQNDRTFGTKPFSRTGGAPKDEAFPSFDNPLLKVEYRGNGISTSNNRIEGRMATTEVEFEVILVNNLTASQNEEELSYNRKAPPRTVRAWITSRRGNITSKIDVIFRQSPFTNASISSGENITVDLANSQNGYWWLGARQPSGNAVRAKKTITGPEVWSKNGKAVQFLPPEGMSGKLNPPYGVLQGENLYMQVDGIHRPLETGTTMLEESEENIQGVLSPGGGAVKIPDLHRKDLQGAARKVDFPYSDLVFRSVESNNGSVVHRLETGNRQMVAEFDPNQYDSRTHVMYDSDGQKIATFDLENRMMVVAPSTELQVPVGFKLSSQTADYQPDSARQPTVILGDSENGASIDSPSIAIEGSVGGFGALKASGGNLEIAAKSALSTTPDFGIALHSEGNVVLTKPGRNASDGLAVDWDAFSMGAQSGGRNANLNRWGYLGENAKQTEASNFKDRMLAPSGGGADFQALWDGLTADFPADARALSQRNEWLKEGKAAVMEPDPSWTPSPEQPEQPEIEVSPAEPAGPGISIDKYVRLREYLKTVKNGKPDPTWLESTSPEIDEARNLDVTNLVKNQLSSYQLAAGQTTTEVDGQPILTWKSLGDYFGQAENPYTANYAPDMMFRGLVYSKGDFIFDTQRQGVYIEGALVTKGNVRIHNATGAHFVYNSDLLQNLFATDKSDLSIPLERAYWAYF